MDALTHYPISLQRQRPVAGLTVFAFILTGIVSPGWAWNPKSDQTLRVQAPLENGMEAGLEERLRPEGAEVAGFMSPEYIVLLDSKKKEAFLFVLGEEKERKLARENYFRDRAIASELAEEIVRRNAEGRFWKTAEDEENFLWQWQPKGSSYKHFSTIGEKRFLEALDRFRKLKKIAQKQISPEKIRQELEEELFELAQRTYLARPVPLHFNPSTNQVELAEWEEVPLAWKNADAKRIRKRQMETVVPAEWSPSVIGRLEQFRRAGYRVTMVPVGFYSPALENVPPGVRVAQLSQVPQEVNALLIKSQIAPQVNRILENRRSPLVVEEAVLPPSMSVADRDLLPIAQAAGETKREQKQSWYRGLGWAAAAAVLGMVSVAQAPEIELDHAGDSGGLSSLTLDGDLPAEAASFTPPLSPEELKPIISVSLPVPEVTLAEPSGLLPEPENPIDLTVEIPSEQAEPEQTQTVQSPSKVRSELPPVDRRNLSFSKQKTAVSSGEELTNYFARNVMPPRLASDKRPAFDFEGPATVEGELQFDRASQEFVYADMKVVAQSPIVITVGEKRFQIPAQTPVELRMDRAGTRINGKGVTSAPSQIKVAAQVVETSSSDQPEDKIELPDVSRVRGRIGPWTAEPGRITQQDYQQLGDTILSHYNRLAGEQESAVQGTRAQVKEGLRRFQDAGPDEQDRRWGDLQDAIDQLIATEREGEATQIRFAEYWIQWFRGMAELAAPAARDKKLQPWQKYIQPLEEIRRKAVLRLQNLLVFQEMSKDLLEWGVLAVPENIAYSGLPFLLKADASLPQEEGEDLLTSVRKVIAERHLLRFRQIDVEMASLDLDQLNRRYRQEIEQYPAAKVLPEEIQRKGRLLKGMIDIAEAKLEGRRQMLRVSLVPPADSERRFAAQRDLNKAVILERQARAAFLRELTDQPVRRYADKRLNEREQLGRRKDQMELDRIGSLGDQMAHLASLGFPLALSDAEWDETARISDLLGQITVGQARENISKATVEYENAQERLAQAHAALGEVRQKRAVGAAAADESRGKIQDARNAAAEAGRKLAQAAAVLRQSSGGKDSYLLSGLILQQAGAPSSFGAQTDLLDFLSSSSSGQAGQDVRHWQSRITEERAAERYFEGQIVRDRMIGDQHWGQSVADAAADVRYQTWAAANAESNIARTERDHERMAVEHALNMLIRSQSAPPAFNSGILAPPVAGLDAPPSEDVVHRHTDALRELERKRLLSEMDRLDTEDALLRLQQPRNPAAPGTLPYDRYEQKFRGWRMAAEHRLAASRAERDRLQAEINMIDAGEDEELLQAARAGYDEAEIERLSRRLGSVEYQLAEVEKGPWGQSLEGELTQARLKALEKQRQDLQQELDRRRAGRTGEEAAEPILGYVRAVQDGQEKLLPLLGEGRMWFDKPRIREGERRRWGAETPYAQNPEGKPDAGLWAPGERILEISEGNQGPVYYVAFSGPWMSYQGPSGYYYVVGKKGAFTLVPVPTPLGELRAQKLDEKGLQVKDAEGGLVMEDVGGVLYPVGEIRDLPRTDGLVSRGNIPVGFRLRRVQIDQYRKFIAGEAPLPLESETKFFGTVFRGGFVTIDPGGENLYGKLNEPGELLPAVRTSLGTRTYEVKVIYRTGKTWSAELFELSEEEAAERQGKVPAVGKPIQPQGGLEEPTAHVFDPANADIGRALYGLHIPDPVVLLAAGAEQEQAILRSGFAGIVLNVASFSGLEEARAAAQALYADSYAVRFYRWEERGLLLGWMGWFIDRYRILAVDLPGFEAVVRQWAALRSA